MTVEERIRALEAERDALAEALERARMQLSACTTAALGFLDEEMASEYWSATLDDVLTLRKEHDALRRSLHQLHQAAMPDPHDERDIDVAWLRKLINEEYANAREWQNAEKTDEVQRKQRHVLAVTIDAALETLNKVRKERDTLAARVKQLETAIAHHKSLFARAAVKADQDLWETLKSDEDGL